MWFINIIFSLIEANQQIFSSPGRSHLERHNEKIKLLHHQNGSNSIISAATSPSKAEIVSSQFQSQSSPSHLYSTYVTPTKSMKSNRGENESRYDLLINIPKTAVEFPLSSPSQQVENKNDNNKNDNNNNTNSNQQENNPTTQEVISTPINLENILDELIHSKLLLASIASELEEEKHVVQILSKANQKYAEKVKK